MDKHGPTKKKKICEQYILKNEIKSETKYKIFDRTI